MVELRRFAEQATPVATDLHEAAPGLTGATKALRPFSRAATISVTSLGDTSAASSDDLAASAPVIRQLRKVARGVAPRRQEPEGAAEHAAARRAASTI